MRMSQARAKQRPAPIAGPLIAAAHGKWRCGKGWRGGEEEAGGTQSEGGKHSWGRRGATRVMLRVTYGGNGKLPNREKPLVEIPHDLRVARRGIMVPVTQEVQVSPGTEGTACASKVAHTR
jgi:hypothetical protein